MVAPRRGRRGGRHHEKRGDGDAPFGGTRGHGRVTATDPGFTPTMQTPMTQPAKPSRSSTPTARIAPAIRGALRTGARVIAGGIPRKPALKPFPIYVDRAQGSHKWDVDGHEYVDYWMGHGALFLGHCHPAVVKAIQEQAGRGTHVGACHELEVRWAELICKLVPSAEMVRFTMSGTEATHLAIRIARAYTGHPKVVKLHGHFHGWHDGVVAGVNPPFDVPMSAGVPSQILDQLLLCPPNDIKAVDGVLQRGDVAAVILEPAAAIGHHDGPSGYSRNCAR